MPGCIVSEKDVDYFTLHEAARRKIAARKTALQSVFDLCYPLLVTAVCIVVGQQFFGIRPDRDLGLGMPQGIVRLIDQLASWL
jgi:hypothetical protein